MRPGPPRQRRIGAEQRNESLAHRHRAERVDLEHPPNLVDRLMRQRSAERHAGVVDQSLEGLPAKLDARFVRGSPHGGGVGHVEQQRLDGLAEFLAQRFRVRDLAHAGEDAPAVADEDLDRAAADAGRSAGDNCVQ